MSEKKVKAEEVKADAKQFEKIAEITYGNIVGDAIQEGKIFTTQATGEYVANEGLEAWREQVMKEAKDQALAAAREEVTKLMASSRESEIAKAAEPPTQSMDDYMEEKVTIQLYYDGDKYKDDLFVAVNGRSFQIQRGIDVQVPRFVAMVIEQQRSQDMAAAKMEKRLSENFARAARENTR